MFELIKNFADFIALKMGLSLTSKLGSSVSFFIEDSIKIFVLIYIMLFVVSLFRKQLEADKIKQYLIGKSRLLGYILAAVLGIITPFCSCSSIPLFITFIAAGLPFGVTMAFLISSPLVSEVAAVMLFMMPEAGPMVCLVYVLVGTIIAILGGWLCDKFGLVKYVQASEAKPPCSCSCSATVSEKIKNTVFYAADYSWETVKGIWLYVFIGLGIGAVMHGFIPQEFFIKYLGKDNFFAVPIAAIVGIPIYANHNSVIPIVQVLLMKGVPVGTSLVMLMSITAISLPEMIMLNKVLKWKMLAIFTGFLFLSFVFVGYLLNWIM